MLISFPKPRNTRFLCASTLFVSGLLYVCVWPHCIQLISMVIRAGDSEPVFTPNVSRIGEIFPLDSRPPITLSGRFLINNKGLCSRYFSLTYVVLVHTAPSHFDRRQSLRNTWARSGIFNGVKSQTIFLLGTTSNESLQKNILSENEKHGDIVQGDFIDDYKNLTLKAISGLRWVTENCPNADYVIKVDDDVFINIFQAISSVFPVLELNPKQVYCSVEATPLIFRVNKNKDRTDKWEISDKYFKTLNKYPMPYCLGYAAFFTTSMAADLLQMAVATPFYFIDDIYVYGILVSKVKGASWRSGRKRYFDNEDDTLKTFLRKENSLVGTVRSTVVMTHMWNSVLVKYSAE